MGRLYVQEATNYICNRCPRCATNTPPQCRPTTMIGGMLLQESANTLCVYCRDHRHNEISVYMHSILATDGVLSCIVVPQLKIVAKLLTRTATQPRGELEATLDILANRVPPNIVLKHIYTSSHYVVFCYKNLSRIKDNERYLNQDCIYELSRQLASTRIMYNRDRDMKNMLVDCISNNNACYDGWSNYTFT